MKMVNSSFTEAIKALYAISALIRNNEVGQKLFYLEDGIIMLQVNNCVSNFGYKFQVWLS